jgi:hypothetical protein
VFSVVVPTIPGREDSLDLCIKSYEATSPSDIDIVVIEGAPNWPSACNQGYLKAEFDVIHFTADDLEATPGWHQEAVEHCVTYNELPAPVVLDHSIDGVWNNSNDGGDGALTHFTRIPLMTRDQYERIGPWPEIPYSSDVWLSMKARTLGIPTRMIHSYRFIHHWSQVGRIDTPENLEYSENQLKMLVAQL